MLTIYQSIYLDKNQHHLSLLDFFLFELQHQLSNSDIFDSIDIIVPNLSIANWLSQNITKTFGVSGNIKFVTLNQFISNIYIKAYPNCKIFNTKSITNKIYDYLTTTNIKNNDFKEIHNFILSQDKLNIFNIYILASQLKVIFEEYLLFRTSEILFSNFIDKLPKYQQKIWQHIFSDTVITNLDIYQFFVSDTTFIYNIIPKNIIIYGVTSIYTSELDIIRSIAKYSTIKWYQINITNKYYGELYSDKSKEKLQKKIFKDPFFSIDDLYLVDGNPLVANLCQKYREFNELILSRDIEIHQLDLFNNNHIDANIDNFTLLELIQYDIHNIIYRCDKKYIIYKNSEFYQDPIFISNKDNSIKINVCHNKMREVQVLFDNICQILSEDSDIYLHDILIIAPDISIYYDYIKAIFDNEYTTSNGEKLFLSYNICGIYNPEDSFYQLIQLLLDLEYHAPISRFFDLLNNAIIRENFMLSNNDIEQIKYWCIHNNISFGLTKDDYDNYNYAKLPSCSIGDLITKLVLGIVIDRVGDIIIINNKEYLKYPNIEINKIDLVTKMGKIYDLYTQLRNLFYINDALYKEFCINEFQHILDNYLKVELTTSMDNYQNFIQLLEENRLNSQINLPILKSVVKSTYAKFNTKIKQVNKILFTSMQLVKNIPYKMIYILGLNFGEMSTINEPNRLSILNKEWMITDRNTNLEDKQTFLSIIIAAKKYLYLSYIGYDNTSNQVVSPSVLVDLLIRVISQSVINHKEVLENIICYHSIYPYKDIDKSYLSFWHNINLKNVFIPQRVWDIDYYTNTLNDNKIEEISYKNFITTFKLTNNNLKRGIGYYKFDEDNLNDFVELDFYSKNSIKKLINLFETNLFTTKLEYLSYANKLYIIQPNSLGDEVFDYTWEIYHHQKQYIKSTHITKILIPNNINLIFNINVDNDNVLLISRDIKSIFKTKLKLEKEQLKSAKIKKTSVLSIKDNYFVLIDAIVSLVLINQYKDIIPNIISDYSLTRIKTQDNIIELRLKSKEDYNIVFDKIMQFYNFSLNNLVLIDSELIDAYYKNRDIYECSDKYNKPNDYKINQDLIFDDIKSEYFNSYNNINNNSILMIIDILDRFDWYIV